MKKTVKFIGLAFSSLLLLLGCDLNPKEWKVPNMTALTPRLQSLFEKTVQVCFGRFVIEVPSSAKIVWGASDIPLGVKVYLNKADDIQKILTDHESKLKSEERFSPGKSLTLYMETIDGAAKGQKTIISQQTFSSTGMLKVESFFKMGAHLVMLDALPLEEQKAEVLEDINDMALRLRPRQAHEVPVESGTCVEGAFMADHTSTVKNSAKTEFIQIGFSLPEFPDMNLSIQLLPGRTSTSKSNTVKHQLEQADKAPAGTYVETVYLRRGERLVNDWTDGFEALTRSAGSQDKELVMHPHHEFILDVQGETGNIFKPHAKVEMYTSVANNKIGATKASLTDAEAIALWDKLTGSIRVRPVKAAPKPVSQADPVPLGTLAATGRACPQTGWWECTESDTVQGGRRQFFRAGERMPEAVLLYAPTLRQRLQGVVPSHRTVTVWKLVERDAAAEG